MFHALLNLVYRIATPKSPRGWLRFHAVKEDGGSWVHCHGMERWDLPNVEFVGVPDELVGIAHGIAVELLDYMKNVKPIRAGEHFGGTLVSPDQPALHLATFRMVQREGDALHSGVLRIVDRYSDGESGFPFRLFAAHLVALANVSNRAEGAEKLARSAIAIHTLAPHLDVSDLAKEYEHGLNQNNFTAYVTLGDALCAQGKTDDGLAMLEEAIARCPSWAKTLVSGAHSISGEAVSRKTAQDPQSAFLSGLKSARIEELASKYIRSR